MTRIPPLAALLLTALLPIEAASAPVEAKTDPDTLNTILGAQTIGAAYQFTKETRLVETAEAIRALGSTVIKFELIKHYAGPLGNVPAANPAIHSLAELARDEPSHRRVLDMPFAFYVLWAHTFHGGEHLWQ